MKSLNDLHAQCSLRPLTYGYGPWGYTGTKDPTFVFFLAGYYLTDFCSCSNSLR